MLIVSKNHIISYVTYISPRQYKFATILFSLIMYSTYFYKTDILYLDYKAIFIYIQQSLYDYKCM